MIHLWSVHDYNKICFYCISYYINISVSFCLNAIRFILLPLSVTNKNIINKALLVPYLNVILKF